MEILQTPTLDPAVMATMVEGAREYSAAVFQITIPESLVPDMNQYVTTQLQTIVTDGRMALNERVASWSQVYSTAQLQFDVALYGAARVVAQQTAVTRFHLFASLLPLFGPAAALAQQQNAGQCCSDTIVEGCSQCDAKPDTVGPTGNEPDTCTIFIIAKYIASFGTSDEKPNCNPTPTSCNNMPNHHVVTLPSGGKICRADGCDESKPGGYQNTSHCRSFPIEPGKVVDPNDKAGSLGVAAPQFVLGDTPFTYLIHFPVQWGGTDAGSGIATYSVFVSENGGPFTPFVTTTGNTIGFARSSCAQVCSGALLL